MPTWDDNILVNRNLCLTPQYPLPLIPYRMLIPYKQDINHSREIIMQNNLNTYH